MFGLLYFLITWYIGTGGVGVGVGFGSSESSTEELELELEESAGSVEGLLKFSV
jgi:hypothetical protein